MGALQYVEVPDYAGMLMRRSFAALSKPGALIPRSHAWLQGTPASWDGLNKQWRFPSGAVLAFGYLDSETDKYQYDSAEYQYIGVDEVTQWPEDFYTYMFGRLRRPEEGPARLVPLRMRSASNPGREGHEWVKKRFNVDGRGGAPFVRADLADNPYIDQESYRRSLMHLDPITREQILNGDWTVRHGGMKFRREWFGIVDDYPRDARAVRFWDLAATAPKKGADPDWTAGCLMVEKRGQFWIVDVKRRQLATFETDALLVQTAQADTKRVLVYIEQEPGASGVRDADRLKREVLKGYPVWTQRSTGSKEIRANPLASAAEAGNVFIVEGDWNEAFLDELELFPRGAHDDQVDAATGAFNVLTGNVVTKDALIWL